MRIKSIHARQVINGKGFPTLQVEIATAKNIAYASVPIASSKSKYEFEDSYDHPYKKFHGESLNRVIHIVDTIIAPELVGKNSMDQDALDKILLKLDNTLDRIHLGVTTISATSQAIARLGALESDLPLYKYLRVLHDFVENPSIRLNSEYRMPKPVVTIHKSSLHDMNNALPAQEIMVLPKNSFTYHRDIVKMYENLIGLDISDDSHTLESYLEAVKKEVNKRSFKFDLGIDMAAARYKRHESGDYVLSRFSSPLVPTRVGASKLVELYLKWVHEHRLVFLEDMFSEDDYAAWKLLKESVEGKGIHAEVVSDDFTATNIERLDKISILECSNNVVIKPSQIGTVTESIHFAQRARKHQHNVTVSYRQGDTEDNFIADLAVSINADFIRTGYYLGSQHNSKINRLIQIEDQVRK